jgi:hypothetical protein
VENHQLAPEYSKKRELTKVEERIKPVGPENTRRADPSMPSLHHTTLRTCSFQPVHSAPFHTIRMSEVVSLLPETIDSVIEFLAFSEQPYRDIQAASLISQVWREPAQRWLFSQLTIDMSHDHESEEAIAHQLERLMFFSTRPDLARYVRSLGVIQAPPKILDAVLHKLLPTIPNVTTYRLRANTIQDYAAGVPINTWTCLEHVEFAFWSSTPYDRSLLHVANPTAVHLSSIDFRGLPQTIADLLNYIGCTFTRQTLRYACLRYDSKWDHDAAWFSKSLQALYGFANVEGLEIVLNFINDEWVSRNALVPGTCSVLWDFRPSRATVKF